MGLIRRFFFRLNRGALVAAMCQVLLHVYRHVNSINNITRRRRCIYFRIGCLMSCWLCVPPCSSQRVAGCLLTGSAKSGRYRRIANSIIMANRSEKRIDNHQQSDSIKVFFLFCRLFCWLTRRVSSTQFHSLILWPYSDCKKVPPPPPDVLYTHVCVCNWNGVVQEQIKPKETTKEKSWNQARDNFSRFLF